MSGFSQVNYATFKRFLESYKGEIREEPNCMHMFYFDASTGEQIASQMHGFFNNIYSIKDEYRNETVEVISSIFERY